MRRPFTTKDLAAMGVDRSQLKRKLRAGSCQRVLRDVYLAGKEPPSDLEAALCLAAGTGGVGSHFLAAALYDFDSARLRAPFVTVPPHSRSRYDGVCRQVLGANEVQLVSGFRATTPLRTLLDLAAHVDAITWEQMLESALRRKLTRVEDLEAALQTRRKGNGVVRQVLSLRPPGAPPTESMLETLMVQLIRTDSGLPEPVRQLWVRNKHDIQIARADLAWPESGVFIELDGQQHKDQPIYDARRETAVVAATGWLPARFTWHEVTRAPRSTARRLIEIFEVAQLNRYGHVSRDSTS